MHDPRRHHRPMRAAAAALGLAVAVLGCGGGAGTPTPGTTQPASPGASSTAPTTGSPIPTAVPGSAVTPPPAATVTPTSATDWGPIWDALPASFPRFPGSTAGEPVEGPASAVYQAPADAAAVATWFQGALEAAAYSTLSWSGPFEDGSQVIESVGPTPACLVQTTVRPADGSALVTILYGAGCPPPAG